MRITVIHDPSSQVMRNQEWAVAWIGAFREQVNWHWTLNGNECESLELE